MSIFENMEYNKFVGTVAVVGTTLLSPVVSDAQEINLQLVQKHSYDKFIDYSSLKQSTSTESSFSNDNNMIKRVEIYEINKIVQEKYSTNILNHWIPASNILEKSCLFVTLENQDILLSKYDDFELELYILLKDKLKQSQLFNMIALM